MTTLRIKAGPYEFEAQTEDLAPNTSVKFLGMPPYRQQIIHVRWSGEGRWIPCESYFGVGYETDEPSGAGRDHSLSWRHQRDENSFGVWSGVVVPAKSGQLAVNDFLTITKGRENLTALGKMTFWKGAQDICSS